MTAEEAKALLSYHSGRNGDFDNEKWRNGFLGSLRPYRGILGPVEANFHEIMECLRILQPCLNGATEIDRSVTADVVSIVHLARNWAVFPEGMLRRNGLLEEAEWQKLDEWLNIILGTFVGLLEFSSETFESYHQYLSENPLSPAP